MEVRLRYQGGLDTTPTIGVCKYIYLLCMREKIGTEIVNFTCLHVSSDRTRPSILAKVTDYGTSIVMGIPFRRPRVTGRDFGSQELIMTRPRSVFLRNPEEEVVTLDVA